MSNLDDFLRHIDRRTMRITTTALSRDPERPDRVDIRFASADGGRPTDIVIHAPAGMLASDIRRLPWTSWISLAETVVRGGDVIRKYGGHGDLIEMEEITVHPPRDRRPGRRGHDDEHYQQVAEVYRAAIAGERRDPTAQVAASFTVSRSTAAGWVRRARARGFLPAARRGRAG